MQQNTTSVANLPSTQHAIFPVQRDFLVFYIKAATSSAPRLASRGSSQTTKSNVQGEADSQLVGASRQKIHVPRELDLISNANAMNSKLPGELPGHWP